VWRGGPGDPRSSRCEVAHPVVLVGKHHDPARRVEERHGAPGVVVDVDPGRRREVVGVVGPRAVELAVADDDTAGIEDLALVLGEEVTCTSCSCGGLRRLCIPSVRIRLLRSA